jgi:hypothetical protein
VLENRIDLIFRNYIDVLVEDKFIFIDINFILQYKILFYFIFKCSRVFLILACKVFLDKK